MEAVTTGVTNLIAVAGSVLDFATSNVLLSIVLVAGTVVPAGFAIFKRAKHAVK